MTKEIQEPSIALDKYSMVILAVREILALNVNMKVSKSKDITNHLAMRIDHLLYLFLNKFDSLPDKEEVNQLFVDRILTTFNSDIFHEMKDGIMPLAIFRELLHDYKVMIDPRLLKNWPKFVDKYASLVLQK
jgi:hypothetical protein